LLSVDILAHALYGATFFSCTGLAGSRQNMSVPRGTYVQDWTVWVAVLFGTLPDLTSIGATFIQMLIRGEPISFHSLPPYVFILYHSTHSLLTASLVLCVIYWLARPLFVPALSWPLHILMDSFSHDSGRWHTLMFYPVSDWYYYGINWWQYPGFMMLYWGILPVLWIGIHFLRQRTAISP
jgi:hypothetical protein